MWNLLRCAFVCIVFGSSLPSTAAQAQLFGSLLGDNQNSNNNNANIPLIGGLLGSNNNQQNRFNPNYNQNNVNQYPNNNNQYNENNNGNRGLLSVLGGNANVNRPNNFNRYPNTGQVNPNKNVNDLKNQMKEAERVLERLKELNRLKEQQKLEKEKENDQGKAGTGNENPVPGNSANNMNVTHVTERTGILKYLTKEKFYFMVKPVVPENEAAKYEQTVYYVD